MAQNNSILYMLAYNNYYNRIIKREETIEDYLPYKAYPELTANFNPADGVDTFHDYNIPYIADTPHADYLVVVDAETSEITSRWFIVNATRNRGGQYHLSLHRDVAADFYNEIITAPAYIERGIANYGNPLIYNSEGLSFNEIKKREILLKDATACPWIVGYVAQDVFETESSITFATTDAGLDVPPTSSFTYEQLQAMSSSGIFGINNITYKVSGYSAAAPVKLTVYNFSAGAENAYTTRAKTDSDDFTIQFPTSAIGNISQGQKSANELQEAVIENKDTLEPAAAAYVNSVVSQSYISTEALQELVNNTEMVVMDSSNNKYSVKIIANNTENRNINVVSGDLYNQMRDMIIDVGILTGADSHNTNLRGMSINANLQTYSLVLSTYTAKGITATIKATNRLLQDAPYRMFCIPYPIDDVGGKATWMVNDVELNLIVDAKTSYNMAIKMAAQLGSKLYDLQLLPYCPCRDLMRNYPTTKPGIDLSNYLHINQNVLTVDESIITLITDSESDTIYSYILWCNQSSMTFSIANPISIPDNAVDFKIEHETSFYRLTSPNYNGSFQFKATANNGIDYFEVNATYKPYQPYIHLNPNFKGLYGGDYNDARGLICGGSFSMPTLSDAWENYQIQNKSYMDAFNRQIENMETTYNIQREQQKTAGVINAISATIGGAAAGGIAGSVGGPIGAGIGATVGGIASGVASGVGLAMDLQYADELHKEAMNYTQDQFQLSLANIKALPYSLSRVSSFDINNKYFPFLEYYSATDEEKQILRDKITYNSMTIGAIGTITNYIQAEPSFISAKIIRLPEFVEDYHMAAAIANEIHKGVYI